MRYLWSFLYNIIVVPFGVLLYILFSVFSKKMRKGIAGRMKTFKKIKELKDKFPDKDLILLHSASLGEYEQVKPVVKGLKQQRSDLITVVSFTSPSGYENADKIPEVDLYIYLPFDLKFTILKFVKTLNPIKIVFVTYELWPNLLEVAKFLGIETYLISARIRKNSKKWKFYINNYFSYLYKSLDHIYTVSDGDKADLIKLSGTSDLNIKTLGDTRYDQVIQRSEARSSKNIPKLFDEGFVVSAGSIWEQDMDVIIPPLIRLLSENDNLKLIIAPHETDEFHVNYIISEFSRSNIKINKYSDVLKKCDNRVLIIDRIGVLAELYHQSDIAFVGGSFKKAIHNVMEPAVAGIPVVFGPKYHNSREAEQLVQFGGGYTCENSDEFYDIIKVLIRDNNKYQKTSRAAKNVIFNNKGAGLRTVNHILED